MYIVGRTVGSAEMILLLYMKELGSAEMIMLFRMAKVLCFSNFVFGVDLILWFY